MMIVQHSCWFLARLTATTERQVHFSSTGLVRYCNNHYSVPIALVHQVVSLHLYSHRIAIVHNIRYAPFINVLLVATR